MSKLKYYYNQVAQSLTQVTNSTFLQEAVKIAPQFKEVASKVSNGLFTNSDIEYLTTLPTGTDNLSSIYAAFMLVGAQFFDGVDFRNVFDKLGIVDRLHMSTGEYVEYNSVGRIPNVSPSFDIKDGDSPDQNEVRLFHLQQDFLGGKNVEYSNWVTFADYDLRRGLMNEGGIGRIISLVYQAIDLDRVTWEEGLLKESLNRAIHSEKFPLQGSQKFAIAAPKSTVANFTADTFTLDELKSFCYGLDEIAEELDTATYSTMFNSYKFPGNLNKDDYVLILRKGYKSKMQELIPEQYHIDFYEKVRFKTTSFADFGGITYKDSSDNELQPVYDKNGSVVGFVNASYTNVAAAEFSEANNKWTVKYGANHGSTADVILANAVVKIDENEDIMAILVEKGLLVELIQNPFVSRSNYNNRGEYLNTWFNQKKNFIGVNAKKGLVIFKRQQHTEA